MKYQCGKCGVPDRICYPHHDCVASVWHAAQRAERRKTVRRVRLCNNARDEISALIAEVYGVRPADRKYSREEVIM
jgi:hypothetical protein